LARRRPHALRTERRPRRLECRRRDVQTLGNDDVARVTLVFGDGTVQMSFDFPSGYFVTLQGQAD
jgi:hypothetical protein